ncbi:MAG: flagellar type III secretion system pore protein FliP [Deltaproteobacteria bacterium]|nr:flagellar type III secretion system pore protein FliP [Deltaproteobacteria bacterium]
MVSKKVLSSFGLAAFGFLFLASSVFADGIPSVNLSVGGTAGPKEISTTLQVLFMITILSLAPAIIVTMTSFTRFVIVFSLLRQAIGVHQVPPNQVLIGLAFFMSFIVMGPTLKRMNEDALQPYQRNELSQKEALEAAGKPLREFMLAHTREKDLALFVSLSNKEKPKTMDEVSMANIIPSFIISELKTAFQIGFMIYVPFLVIDIVIASVLLAMGMLVLPPVIISLPFKLMLFVLVDGWNLIVGSLIKSFEVGV